MSYVAIWLQACLHWRCAYFQTLSWNDTIIVADWDILYKLCGSTNKWSKGFVFSGKIRWQFFSCNKGRSDYRTGSTITPKYTLPQRLVYILQRVFVSLGCRGRQNSQSDFFNMKPPKIAFLNGFLSHCWEKDRWWHGRFHVKMKETGEFWGKILNWFVGIDLETIFPQNMFYSIPGIEPLDAAEL